MRTSSSKWFLPGFALGIGLAMLAAAWAGGSPGGGLIALGVMAAFGALVLLGGRSETVRGLRGDGRDERFRRIDLQATAFAGVAVIVAIGLGFLVEVARGHDGSPYTWLGAVAGGAYLLAVLILRVRG